MLLVARQKGSGLTLSREVCVGERNGRISGDGYVLGYPFE